MYPKCPSRPVWQNNDDPDFLFFPSRGGTLTTAGNLVFQGTADGRFIAYNATTGEKLWDSPTGTGVVAAASTYMVDGKQYVAVVVGRTAALPAFLGDIGKKMTAAAPEGGALFVFAVQ